MGLFSSKPDPKEVRGFGRGKPASGKAAAQYAQNARDKAAGRRSGGNLAARSAAWKKAQKGK